MTLPRRQFLSTIVSVVGAAVAPHRVQAQTRSTINVKSVGAAGDGKLSDLEHVRAAIAMAAERRDGATVFFPPGEYFLGTADDAYLLSLTKMRNIRFVGEQATLSCRSVRGQSSMLVLAGCHNVTVEGLAFRDYGLNREINWLGAAAIRLTNEGATGCEKIEIKNCTFESVLSAVVCRTFDTAARSRHLVLQNLSVTRSYYGFSFQDSCDDVVGRRLRCDNVKRSYFPFGVSNHDIELETINNTTGFTDVLIKCYHKDTSGLKVKVKCRGKRSGDAIVALDQQHEKGQGLIRNISLDLDVDDADCRLNTVVLIRSFDPKARVERETANRWDDIAINGDVRICDNTKLIEIVTLSKTPGTLHIGARLAGHPRLPARFPGFTVTASRESAGQR